jgi:DNA adenine methylase
MAHKQSTKTPAERVRAPFAWYGGKQKMASWLIERFPEHSLYVEPFCGAGHVLFAKPPSPAEILNDLDHRLWNFFKVVQDPELLADLLFALESTPYARQELADVLAAPETDDPVELARRFFVLMNQVISGCGMSRKVTEASWSTRRRVRNGLHEGVSKWLSAIALLRLVHERLKRVAIECRPALEIIQNYDSGDAFFYVDPTYLAETRHGKKANTYAYEMTREDHEALLDLLLTVKGKVMISGYASDLYDSKLADWRRDTKEVKSQAANSGQRRVEVVWMNY